MTFEEWLGKQTTDYITFKDVWDAAIHNAADDRRAHIVCQECADAAEWHLAIMEEPCDGDVHCTCVPVLRQAIAEKDAEIRQLTQDYDDEHARFKARGAELDRKDAEIARLTATLPCGHPKHYCDDSYGGCTTCAFHRNEVEADAEIAKLTTEVELLRACKEGTEIRSQLAELQSATRRLVELIDSFVSCENQQLGYCEVSTRYLRLKAALADPVIVALRRE